MPMLILAPITSFILPLAFNYSDLVVLTPFYGAFFAFLIGFAIVKHQLFDIRAIVARSVAYVLSLTVFGLLYSIVVLSLANVLFDLKMTIYQQIYLSVATGIAVMVFQRFVQLFARITNRYFFRDAYDPQDLFGDLNENLVNSIDLQYVAQSTYAIVSKHLKSSFITMLLISEDDEQEFKEIGAKHISNLNEFGKACEKYCKELPLITDDIDSDDQQEVQAIFRENTVSVVVPIITKSSKYSKAGQRLGYLIIGQKQTGNPYDSRDINVIVSVTKELSLALQNALHYEEIQKFNKTLQEKVDDATHKLKATNDKLKRMDETKDEFISMASHQLRTPLTSVKGYVSMVLDGDVGPISDQQRELLNQSFQSSQRMANLISDLLNLSRINTGKFVIELSPVDLRGVVTAELEQLREMAVDKNIKLTYDPPADFPTLMLDDGKMHQVVMNLIDNALYYTPAGGSVTVTLTETPTAVEFRVIDTGIGVPRDSERHLFTKMYRAENARRARPDGTGLGLFMVKKVVIEQKGAIIFETEEGKGSTFGFKFNKADHLVTEAAIKAAAA